MTGVKQRIKKPILNESVIMQRLISGELVTIKLRASKGSKKASSVFIQYLLWMQFPSELKRTLLINAYTKYKHAFKEVIWG
jgi:tryptophan-rich sensory protein